MAEIQKAAEAASANDFIQKLEEKYDSMIGHLYWVGLGKKPKNHLFERVVVKGAVNIERVLFFQMTFATKMWTNPQITVKMVNLSFHPSFLLFLPRWRWDSAQWRATATSSHRQSLAATTKAVVIGWGDCGKGSARAILEVGRFNNFGQLILDLFFFLRKILDTIYFFF